jgi:hypothetical protein
MYVRITKTEMTSLYRIGTQLLPRRDVLLPSVSRQISVIFFADTGLISTANVYQHKVSGFKLIDPSKPGHRKIVALFLCDPGMKVPSATTVGPQQKEWLVEGLAESRAVEVFPPELISMMTKNVPGGTSPLSVFF